MFTTSVGITAVEYKTSIRDKALAYNAQDFMVKLLNDQIRLKNFYRYGQTDIRRIQVDMGKKDFFDVWKDTVPAPFNKDKKHAQRVGDLMKF